MRSSCPRVMPFLRIPLGVLDAGPSVFDFKHRQLGSICVADEHIPWNGTRFQRRTIAYGEMSTTGPSLVAI
jgi:hypothetical protein